MNDPIIMILWLVATWYVAKFIIGFINFYKGKTTEIEKELLTKLNDMVHIVRVETHGDVHYWYDQDDHEFLGQGKTIPELTQAVKSRFPDHIFFMATPDNEKFILSKNTDWKLNKVEI